MYSFKKAERLKSKKIIDLLFKKGNAIYDFPIKAVWIETKFGADELKVQAAFSVSKRKHKKAVVRNRIKRLMREVYRLNKADLYDFLNQRNMQLAVMFIYSGEEIPGYLKVEGKIIDALNRLMSDIEVKSK